MTDESSINYSLIYIFLLVIGILIYFLKYFDKNRYYFKPLYTPSPEYWYPEWQTEMSIQHTYKTTNEYGNEIRLHGYISLPIKNVLPSDIIILYLHGNSGNIYTRIPHFKDIVNNLDKTYADGNGCITGTREHVLVSFDYRGFGLSNGSPTPDGILEDGLQMWKWCKSQFPQNKIVLYGESIGTSVVSFMASRGAYADGIILKSPFASMHSLVADMFHLPRFISQIPKWIIPDDFLTAEWLADIYDAISLEFNKGRSTIQKKPEIVILHNKNDELIPTRNIQGLLDKYKSFCIEGGHNDCSLEGVWLEGVCSVLDKI